MNKNDYIYLDHAATTPMREVAFEAYKKTEIDAYANSSGGHALSRKAKNILEESREYIASCFGAAPNEITFTSGGTEADNWIIKTPFVDKDTSAELTTTQIEHEAVLASAENVHSNGFNVNFVSCDSEGTTNIDEFKKSINGNTLIASVMYANNETGVVQPIEEMSKIVKEINPNTLFHSDVVQAVATKKLNFHNLGIDSAAISGHKIGGPKGIGVMFLKTGYKIPSFLHGGKQELERRAGTVNVSGVAGLAAALKEQQNNLEKDVELIEKEKTIFENHLKENIELRVVGENVERLCHISNIQFKDINSETLMVALDLNGMGVSRGSACASGAQKPSHVLEAMKVDELVINNHLRFSFGWNTQKGDGGKCAEIVEKTIKELS
jgi:cysteine desulfurase